ncbi:MAG: hypothetical protein AAGA92_08305 [Planctomycetota bacterium]
MLAPTTGALLLAAFLGAPTAAQLRDPQLVRALEASELDLSGEALLPDVLASIEKQTGNRLVDFRQQFNQDTDEVRVVFDHTEKEFWPVVDAMLDNTGLDLYPYSGEGAMAVVRREADLGLRKGRAVYSGPFRLDVTNIYAHSDLRSLKPGSLQLELEISWEPKVKPLALSQPLAALTVLADDSSWVRPSTMVESLDVEVQPGSYAAELTVPLELPRRDISMIASLEGQMVALVPEEVTEFRFQDLESEDDDTNTQTTGGIRVALEGVRRNQELWELRMRVTILSDDSRLLSATSWLFQNLTYLETADGEKIDHAGLETTMQSENELGLAYFFDAPGELSEYDWVYRSPTNVGLVPVEFELRNIPLP